jgi:prepilin-type N-terminal cleavage/methylation domain-containing protein
MDRGFTLVEMLVVIAIIALLLAALLPAFSSVKTSAKKAQTTAYFTALDTGISSYRAEQPLGGSLPPSASDAPVDNLQKIAIPSADSASSPMDVAGAHLLAMAMIGADGLGTPGFKDLSSPADGFWWDNTNKNRDTGAYYVDPTTGKEKHPRYGPYVDEKMRDRAKSLKDLADKGGLLNPDDAGLAVRGESPLLLFVDSWDHPILYYKSSPASNRMVTILPGTPGIYRQEDNGLITGTTNGGATWGGLDFGAGMENGVYHFIANARSPAATDPVQPILESADWNNTFARFIIDPKAKARPTPVQKDSYLLISAGPDSRYGTADDITNWTRETN